MRAWVQFIWPRKGEEMLAAYWW